MEAFQVAQFSTALDDLTVSVCSEVRRAVTREEILEALNDALIQHEMLCESVPF